MRHSRFYTIVQIVFRILLTKYFFFYLRIHHRIVVVSRFHRTVVFSIFRFSVRMCIRMSKVAISPYKYSISFLFVNTKLNLPLQCKIKRLMPVRGLKKVHSKNSSKSSGFFVKCCILKKIFLFSNLWIHNFQIKKLFSGLRSPLSQMTCYCGGLTK